MAKIEDVVRQLASVLPKYSDNFCDTFAIASVAARGSNIFRVTTEEAHHIKTSVSAYARIYGVGVQNPIVDVNAADGVITFTTEFAHDLTEWRKVGETPNVNLTGFTGLDDGDYPLLAVPDANSFQIESEDVITDFGVLNEIRIDGINGNYTATVISATAFDVTAPDCAFEDFNVVEDESVVTTNPRITGLASVQDIEKYYSAQCKQTDFWAFVINEDCRISHDRRVESDANQRKDRSEEIRFEGNEPFSVYVVAPQREHYGGRMISDEMKVIRRALCRSLVGTYFDSGFSEETRFATTFLGDGFFAYVGAYYIHKFTFETVFMFNPEDAVDPADTRAFRRFEINIKLPFDNFDEVKKIVEGNIP